MLACWELYFHAVTALHPYRHFVDLLPSRRCQSRQVRHTSARWTKYISAQRDDILTSFRDARSRLRLAQAFVQSPTSSAVAV